MKRNEQIYFIVDSTKDSTMVNCYLKNGNQNIGYFIYEYFINKKECFDDIHVGETMILKFIEIHDRFKYLGYGSKLMKEFMNHFEKQNKVNNIILEARPFNSEIGLPENLLIKFYNKFNFKVIDDTNGIIMQKFKSNDKK